MLQLVSLVVGFVILPSGASHASVQGGLRGGVVHNPVSLTRSAIPNGRALATLSTTYDYQKELDALNLFDDMDKVAPEARMALIGPLSGFLLKGLANGALGHVGGEATGWILGKVGLVDNAMEESLDEIKQQLKEQSLMLKNIQKGLNELKQQLAAAVDEIKKAIKDEHERTRFDLRVSNLNQNVATLLAYSDSLEVWSDQEPSETQQTMISNFRNSILDPKNVPKAIRAIDGELRGTPSSEGLIQLWSRLSMSDTNLYQYGKEFSDMFEYYYSYQILGLQLMFEAYHSFDPPQFGAIESYYNIWTGFVSECTDDYMARAPMATKTSEFEMVPNDSRDHVIGRFEHMVTSDDRVYILNNTGWLHSTTLDGQDLRSVDVGIDHILSNFEGYSTIPILQVHGNSVVVGGQFSQRIKVAKYKKDSLASQGSHLITKTSSSQVALLRGGAFNSDGLLYLNQVEVEGRIEDKNTTLQAFDISSMNYIPGMSVFVKKDSKPMLPSDVVFIENDIAVIFLGHGEIGLINISQKKIVSKYSYTASGGTFQTDSGLVVTHTWLWGTISLVVRNRSGEIVSSKLLMTPSISSPTSAGATGLTVYSVHGPGDPIMSANFTLVDPKETMIAPLDESGFQYSINAIYVSESGENVYAAGRPRGKIATYDVSFPIGNPPPLEK